MKKLMPLIVTVILMFSAFPSQIKAVVSFDDVPMSYQFSWEIIYLNKEGVIDGYPDGTFHPGETVTRAQAIKMLGRAIYLDETKRQPPFKDVSASHFASGFITSAYEKDITRGYPDGTFGPNIMLTRGQAAMLLARAYDYPDAPNPEYEDVNQSMEAFKAITEIADQGVTTGYPDNTFRPNQLITRGQFATFMARAVEPTFVEKHRELLQTANNILVHIQDGDFEAVAGYTNPNEGIQLCPYSGGCIDHGGVIFTETQMKNFLDDEAMYEWGYADGTGDPIELNTSSYYEEYMINAPYDQKETFGRTKQPTTHEFIKQLYPDSKVVEFYFPGTDQYDRMDWQNLNMVFEKDSAGEWKLVAIINDRWTI